MICICVCIHTYVFEMNLSKCMCICVLILYSGKLLREKNFEVLWLFAKDFSMACVLNSNTFSTTAIAYRSCMLPRFCWQGRSCPMAPETHMVVSDNRLYCMCSCSFCQILLVPTLSSPLFQVSISMCASLVPRPHLACVSLAVY